MYEYRTVVHNNMKELKLIFVLERIQYYTITLITICYSSLKYTFLTANGANYDTFYFESADKKQYFNNNVGYVKFKN